MAKFKSFRTLAVAAGIAAVAAVPLAWAAGMFSGLPIAGGASYCSSFSGTGSGTGSSTFPGSASGFAQVCNVTVPAGPDVSGTFLIPADTQALHAAQRKAAVRTAWILASVAALFFAGVIARHALFH